MEKSLRDADGSEIIGIPTLECHLRNFRESKVIFSFAGSKF